MKSLHEVQLGCILAFGGRISCLHDDDVISFPVQISPSTFLCAFCLSYSCPDSTFQVFARHVDLRLGRSLSPGTRKMKEGMKRKMVLSFIESSLVDMKEREELGRGRWWMIGSQLRLSNVQNHKVGMNPKIAPIHNTKGAYSPP